MAIHVQYSVSRASRPGPRATSALAASVAIALGGCSINLGSLLPGSDDAPKPAAADTSASTGTSTIEAQAATTRGQVLARTRKTEQALAEFDKAIALDPHNGQALYSRGLLYQGE